MYEPNIGQLRTLCASFRWAVQQSPVKDRLFSLREFPLGSCSDASLLLAEFLHDNLFPYPDLVTGQCSGEGSHAWLEFGDVILDVTADQFPDGPAAVIVTRDRTWHSRFKETDRCAADMRVFGKVKAAELLRGYQVVVKYVEKKVPSE